ncbi:MAG: preprotein translocase subunit SecE [Deltaproteobacteria bacterium]|nr:preprotein translocase subunit SecE [Deltaproteobacteria bacterium]
MDIVAYPNFRVLEVAPISAVVGSLVATIAGLICFTRASVQAYSLEVLQELKKVTWPLRKTAYLSTVVVIVLVVICAVFLGFFDMASNWFIGSILSV